MSSNDSSSSSPSTNATVPPKTPLTPEELEKKWGGKIYTSLGQSRSSAQHEINELEDSLESEKLKGQRKFEDRMQNKMLSMAKSKEHLYKSEEKSLSKDIPIDGDFIEGSRVFMRNCAGCHSLESNNLARKTSGPALGLIYGRRAGADPYYMYSPSMAKSTYVWTSRNLFYFLRSPRLMVNQNRCEIVNGGIQDEEERADLIQFLKVFSKQLSENMRHKANKVYGKDYINYQLQSQLQVEQERHRRASDNSQ